MFALIRYSPFTFFYKYISLPFMIFNVIYIVNIIFHCFGYTETCCLFQAALSNSGMWELMLRISVSQGRPAEKNRTLV